ncbi:hypothetical protein [Bacillus kwashiorkori]|uniref:hypothetical protein n=1 Tax=Bacillus kwashiorkori TaxID=1522318 RepID=UPI000B1E2CA8|nr:hypothetical protein [Bacillus kwashiorkori]
MGRSSKSKRFVKQGVDAVTKHAEKFPYRFTYAEAEARKMSNIHDSSLGGIE